MVYLHRSPEQLLKNIRERGRHYEMAITSEYLLAIQDSYFDFFKSQMTYPILILEVEDMDFVGNSQHRDEILYLIRQKYRPGTHRIKLHL